MNSTYNLVLESDNVTVVTEYKKAKGRDKSYQSELELEKEFIEMLKSNGYQYLYKKKEADLIENLRERLEELNNYKFTDYEWDIFFNEIIANKNDGIGDMKLGDYQDNTIDAFGDAYEYLMSMYASNAGKSGGEIFTPQEVSELLTKIAISDKKEINKIYDSKTMSLIQNYICQRLKNVA